MFRVLVTGRNFASVTPDFNYFIERGYEIVENPYKGRMPNEEELCAVIGDVDAILVGNDRISAKVLACAKRLKVVAKSGIGVDNIDVDRCSEMGIAVVNVPGTTAIPVAELTIAMMLNISKLIMYTNRRVMGGMWPVDRGHDVFGKKLGIVGFGRIGQQVAKRAKAFDMELYAYDPFMNHEKAEELGVTVHRATDAPDACAIVARIAKDEGCRKIIKSKSMTAEEIRLNPALEREGFEVVESDLGEWILQLRNEGPSHMVMPAIHLSRGQVARTFAAGAPRQPAPDPDDITALVRLARRELRRHFAEADMGISGANFVLAENGAVGLVTNEGNARLVTTLPRVHVVLCGLDKLADTAERPGPP